MIGKYSSAFVATYDYSPFGQLIATSGTPERSHIQFSSEVFDPETALTYYNHRYYNPTDGRWLARDPAGESASLNLYAFTNNAPIYRLDKLGLFCLNFDVSNEAAIAQANSLPGYLYKKCPDNTRTRICSDETISYLGVSQSFVKAEYRTKEPNPDYTPTSNGCGPEGGDKLQIVLSLLQFLYDYDFTNACNAHDICYGTCGKSKKDCDTDFLTNMAAYCAQRGNVDKMNTCISFAYTYFSFVSLGGENAYQAAQDQACIWKPCHCSGK